MNKTIIKAVIGIGCFLIAGGAFGVELVIPSDVSTTLNRELGRSYNKYTVDAAESLRVQNAFGDWVIQTMSFDMATRTESLRFGGTTAYYQELEENKALYVHDRPGQTPLPATRPVPIVCKMAADRYTFRKLLDVEATQEVSEGYALEIAQSFLSNRGFVKQTSFDKYGDISFSQLREKRAPHDDTPEQDVLLFQQARFGRQFLNSAVMNSRISIDFHPDNLEILGFKHYNWTPVHEKSPIYIPPYNKKTRAQVEAVLEERIREFWSESQRATLTSAEQMWFQTPTELIPILVCTLEREPTPTGCGDTCTMMVNIAGSEMVFYATPKVTPIFPVASDCFPSTNTTYDDWRALGSPSCWCNPYQCDGDADGINSGVPYYYRIYTGDVGQIIANWRKKIDDPALNPCADIDHISSGAPYYYRVYTGDIGRIIATWRRKDAGTGGTALPGNCPRPE
jgi:hypothetical protein